MSALRLFSRWVLLGTMGLPGLFLVPSTAAFAVAILQEPPFSQDVFCGVEKCGTMEISKYSTINPDSVNGVGGVDIEGKFTATKKLTYHYVQAVTQADGDRVRWFNDTSVPLPAQFLDPPPGGYKFENGIGTKNYTINNAFDYLPWYDQGEFPDFGDEPTALVLRSKLEADSTLTTNFETWLVCVIEDVHDNDNQAKDDRYTIAPLLGWVWGFDIAYADVAPLGADNLADFVVNRLPFAFVNAPSASWTNALSAVYGAGALQDFWSITVGNCENCQIPEPSTAMLLSLPALLLLLAFRRRSLFAR